MKLHTILLSLCLVSALHAGATQVAPKAEAPAPVTTSAAAAPPASVQLASVKDEFLRFTLQKAEKYSGKLENGIGAAVDEARKQAPELAKEFLLWRFLVAASNFMVPLVLMLIFIWVSKAHTTGWCKAWKEANVAAAARAADRYGRHDWMGDEYLKCWRYGPIALLSGVGVAISLGITIANLGSLSTMIEIYFAPRIYIADQLLQLIKR